MLLSSHSEINWLGYCIYALSSGMHSAFHPSEKLPGRQGKGMHYWHVPHVFPSQLQSTGVVQENNSSKVDNNRYAVAGVNLYFMEATRVISCSLKKPNSQKTKPSPKTQKMCKRIFMKSRENFSQKVNLLMKAGTDLGLEASYSVPAAGALGEAGALSGAPAREGRAFSAKGKWSLLISISWKTAFARTREWTLVRVS